MQTMCFSSKSGDLPDYTCTEKALGGQRGMMLLMPGYPQASSVESILVKSTHGRILRYTRQINMIGQRRQKCPIKVIQTASRGQVSYSLSLCLPVCLSTCTILFFNLLINNLLPSLLSVFVEILLCKAEGQGPCH